jgi:hypothetical protein
MTGRAGPGVRCPVGFGADFGESLNGSSGRLGGVESEMQRRGGRDSSRVGARRLCKEFSLAPVLDATPMPRRGRVRNLARLGGARPRVFTKRDTGRARRVYDDGHRAASAACARLLSARGRVALRAKELEERDLFDGVLGLLPGDAARAAWAELFYRTPALVGFEHGRVYVA